MKLPEYITKEEVRRVCKELGISDWTKIKEPKITLQEAKIILRQTATAGLKIDPGQFRTGLEVELEHGTRFREANVTNNHPLITAKIVIAHMLEFLDYYMRLDISESEGDLYKAVVSGNMVKIRKYYRKAMTGKIDLAKAEVKRL